MKPLKLLQISPGGQIMDPPETVPAAGLVKTLRFKWVRCARGGSIQSGEASLAAEWLMNRWTSSWGWTAPSSTRFAMEHLDSRQMDQAAPRCSPANPTPHCFLLSWLWEASIDVLNPKFQNVHRKDDIVRCWTPAYPFEVCACFIPSYKFYWDILIIFVGFISFGCVVRFC